MLHPASLLLIWGAGLFLIQFLDAEAVPIAAVILGGLAIFVSRRGLLAILRRTRWLFLTMAVMFLFLTPGIRLSAPWGDIGLTREGLESVVEHGLRLFGQLAWLVVLVGRLGTDGLVAGMYALLRYLPGMSRTGNVLVIRLALTLDEIGADHPRHWRDYLQGEGQDGASTIKVLAPPWSLRDSVVVALGLAAAILVAWIASI